MVHAARGIDAGMDAFTFERLASETLTPCLEPLGFRSGQWRINGKEYFRSFESRTHRVEVSYEPGDDYLSVTVAPIGARTLEDMDNPRVTRSVSDLAEAYAQRTTREQREENQRWFAGIEATEPAAKRMLNAAKTLRLVLPLHLASEASR